MTCNETKSKILNKAKGTGCVMSVNDFLKIQNWEQTCSKHLTSERASKSINIKHNTISWYFTSLYLRLVCRQSSLSPEILSYSYSLDESAVYD